MSSTPDYYIDPTRAFRHASSSAGAFAAARRSSHAELDPPLPSRIDTGLGSRRGSALSDRSANWREEAKKSPVNRRPSWRDDRAPDFRMSADQRHAATFEDDSESDLEVPSKPVVKMSKSTPTAEAMSIRKLPRPSYSAIAATPAKRLADPPRKLLLLDLNGTLLFRTTKTKSGSKKPMLRPFLDAFLRYCLGSVPKRSSDGQAKSGADASLEKLGTHFHAMSISEDGDLTPTQGDDKKQRSDDGRSRGAYELIVWSSAQPANVDSMLVAALDPTHCARLLRVWARDTLVPQQFYWGKAQTTKDLEVVWHALNLNSEARLRAEARAAEDRKNPDDSAKEGLGAAGKGAATADAAGPWNARNTLLLDDSLDKARMQPFNHLCVPEFTAKEVDQLKTLKLSAKRELASVLQAPLRAWGKDDEDELLEAQRDVLEDYDSFLLQTIGVLEHLRWQDNVAGWIKAGGLEGYGTAQQGSKNAEYWMLEGLKALEKEGIETTLQEQLLQTES